jgi:hypothetical protein
MQTPCLHELRSAVQECNLNTVRAFVRTALLSAYCSFDWWLFERIQMEGCEPALPTISEFPRDFGVRP